MIIIYISTSSHIMAVHIGSIFVSVVATTEIKIDSYSYIVLSCILLKKGL